MGKRVYTGPKWRTLGEGNNDRHTQPARTFYFEAKLINDHVTIKIPQCTLEDVKLLLDTGSDLNMIKLSTLKDEVMIDETHCYQLKEINEYLVRTIGFVSLDLNLGSKVIKTQFQVIQDDFPIPHAGISGKLFFIENNIAIDYHSSKILQSHSDHFKLAPRSETVIPISSSKPEGTALLIHAQSLQDKAVRLGNVVNTVKQGEIMTAAINTSENLITLPFINIEEF